MSDARAPLTEGSVSLRLPGTDMIGCNVTLELLSSLLIFLYNAATLTCKLSAASWSLLRWRSIESGWLVSDMILPAACMQVLPTRPARPHRKLSHMLDRDKRDKRCTCNFNKQGKIETTSFMTSLTPGPGHVLNPTPAHMELGLPCRRRKEERRRAGTHFNSISLSLSFYLSLYRSVPVTLHCNEQNSRLR